MASAKSLEFRKRLDRSLVYLFAPHPRHPLRTISTYLLGLMWVSVLGNFIYDWLKGDAHSLRPLWVCLGAAALVFGFSYLRRLDDPTPISKGLEAVPPPRMRGLVFVLSPYSQRHGTTFEEFKRLLSNKGKTDQDWQQLERLAEESNFDVPLQAIRYHLEERSLQHVWLICTDDARDEEGEVILRDGSNPQSPGSWRLAPCLECFIQEAPHQKLIGSTKECFDSSTKVQFHYHSVQNPRPSYLVSFFGEQGARDSFKAVNYIFDAEAELVGLEPESIICDFTGGRAPHTVGMVLACLPARRRIQYTSSPQDSTGAYVGRPLPREIRVDSSWVAKLITLEDLLQRLQDTPGMMKPCVL